MTRLHQLLAIFASLFLWAASASASVLYSFEALSSYSGLTGNFVYESPTFIGANTTVTPAQLNSANLYPSGVPGVTLGNVWFYPGLDFAGGLYDVIGFGTETRHDLFYFDKGAFGAAGAYDTRQFGTEQQGILTVSLAAVPEPEIFAMLLTGLGLLGATAWRNRIKQV
jgi:hypothetical protein